MANSFIPTDGEVKIWAKMDMVDMMKSTYFGLCISEGYTSINDSLREAGDRVTTTQTSILSGLGKGEGQTLVGNEEALNFGTDQMFINEFRHAVQVPNKGTVQQQRTYVNMENTARKLLKDYFAARLDASLFNQLGGNTATTIVADTAVYTGSSLSLIRGNNTATAPTSSRVVRPGSIANDQSLTSADTFSLDMIDDALTLARASYPNMRPGKSGRYALFVSPGQFLQIKREQSSAVTFTQMGLAMIQGGKTDGGSLTTGPMFAQAPVAKYDLVDIYVTTRVPNGVNSSTSARLSNVRRAVLVGQESSTFASPYAGSLVDLTTFSKEGNVPLKYKVEMKDFDHDLAVAGEMLYGIKKNVFSPEGFAQDLAVIVLSSYATN